MIDKWREDVKGYPRWTPEGEYAATAVELCARELEAALVAVPRDDRLQPITGVAINSPQPMPIPLNDEQLHAAKLWAEDDRLWTTQDTVEFNLVTFARVILKLLSAPEEGRPQP